MPNHNYLAGYRFELQVLKKLESLGYFVARQGASRFPDSIAVGKSLTFFIECKTRKVMPKDRMKLLSLEEITKAYKIIDFTGKPLFLIWHEGRIIKVMSVGGKDVLFASALEMKMNGPGKDIWG